MGASDIIGQLRSGITQNDRLVKIDTPLGSNSVLVQRVVGTSRAGRDYEFTVDFVSLDDSVQLKDLIAQPVTLWLQQTDKSYKPFNGYVHTARRLGSDGSLSSYQLILGCWLHFLRFRSDARIWQNVTADEIITQVFNQHPQAQGAFRFDLTNQVKPRSFCVQYESDWNFVNRLMEMEGWFGYFEQSSDGKSHTLVLTDDLYSFKPANPQQISFYRAGTKSEADAFVQWAGTRTLQSTSLTTSTFDYKAPQTSKGTNVPTMGNQGSLPSQTEVYQYSGAYTYLEQNRGDALSKIRMQEWESRAKRFCGVGSVRSVDVGRWFELVDHPEHDQDSAQNRQFAVIAVEWVIENNLPVTGNAADYPHSLKSRVTALRGTYTANDPSSTRAGDGSDGFFMAMVEAQRRTVPFRSPFEHLKPVMPAQTATVVGPTGEEVFTDDLNRVKVCMHWDRINTGDENASCWVRVSYPNAGQNWGGVFVPRIGQEVVITYIDGDPDRPLITGRVYNAVTTPQWHTQGQLSGYKSKEYKGSGFNQLVLDDSTGQNRTQLYSSSASSQLNLGYLVAQNGNTRGQFRGTGFELATDSYGAIRTQKGLYISTFGRSGASGEQLDVTEASGQLSAGQQLLQATSDTATQHGAADMQAIGSLKTFTAATQSSSSGAAGQANGFSDPVLLIASPKGVAITTPTSIHMHAGENATVSTNQDFNLATGKSLVANAVEKISLFAYKMGMKLIAASGKVEIQAQTGGIDLLASKGIKMSSSTDSIQVSASKEILLTAGGGYIRISGGNIQIHAPGSVDIKGAQHSFSGPASYDGKPPALPTSIGNDQQFILKDKSTGNLMPFAPYRIEGEGGSVLARGTTDAEGKTVRVFTGTKAQAVNMFHEDDE